MDTVTSKMRPKTSKIIPENNRNNKHLENNKPDKIFESINEFSNASNSIPFVISSNNNNLNNQLKNLKKISLIETDIDNLYKWEHLFNNFRPISSYITINNQKNEKKEENKNEEFKSPILLVDLPENQMNLFFGNTHYDSSSRNKKKFENIQNNLEKTKINSYFNNHSNQNTNHNIRPMSMYSPRIQNSCYYFSSVFSDYYKEDFKSFCNKMPILKAKLKISPDKLKREIIKQDKINNQKEKILNQLCSFENIILDKQDLIIAGKRKNPIPLLKSIFKQNYPGYEVIKENPKLYLKTMKPFGKDDGNVDYFQNDRWKLSNEIIKMRNKYNKNEKLNNYYEHKYNHKKKQLFLSYYDTNDPYIVLFNKNIKNSSSPHILKDKNKVNSFNVNCLKTKINLDLIDKKEIENKDPTSERKDIYLKSKTSENINKKGGDDPQKKNTKLENIQKGDKKVKKNNIYNTTLNNLGEKDENLYKNFSYSISFPLKTSSDVGNTSYNKINRFLREKKLLNKLKIDYSLTQPKISKKALTKDTDTDMVDTQRIFEENKNEINLMIENKKIKPKKNISLYETAITDDKNSNHNNLKQYKHWDKGGNLISNKSHKVNYLCFNNFFKTSFNKDLIRFKKNEDNQYFYPMNAYNKLAGKYYRSSDKDFKDKNNKSNNIIQNLFDYSRDEPENDFETTRKTELKKENDELYNQLNNSSKKLK